MAPRASPNPVTQKCLIPLPRATHQGPGRVGTRQKQLDGGGAARGDIDQSWELERLEGVSQGDPSEPDPAAGVQEGSWGD